ncbi:MAG: M23 family metallopeptidase [Pseudomonadota bacterium]|nr:M23 family metallopeptidase [Pseudomonadota bacterium]
MRTDRLPLAALALAGFFVATINAYSDPPSAIPGGVYLFPIPNGATDIRFRDKPVFTINDHALIAIPMQQTPGSATLTYKVQKETKSHPFTVRSHAYTEQHITLENEAMVTPPDDVRERIQEESRRQRRLYIQHRPEQSVDDGFMKPLQGITTSLFGHKRFFNGKPRSPHSGLDIAADTGTPIAAAGGGTITLSDALYFNGNTIFIDHGKGLVTMYCHMSKLDVREGASVNKGQTIGRVGSTGRATGPHLHWSVSLNGVRVNPTLFMQLLNQVIKAG